MFLNNRYQDPNSGVFLSVDPLVGKTGTPYLYGNGNPATLADPSGLDPDTDARIRDRAKANGRCTYSAAVSSSNACGANGVYWGPSSDPVLAALAERNMVKGPVAPGCSAKVDVSPSGNCVGSYSPSTAGPPAPSWIKEPGGAFVGNGSVTKLSVPADKCDFYSCDLYVVMTYIGGDVAGGGSVSVSFFDGGEQHFADVGLAVSPNGLSTAMFFPRNHVSTESSFWDLYSQLDPSVTPTQAVRNAILNPPDAEITINVEMVGISDAVRAAGVGSGASYFVEVWWNPGGAAGGQPGSTTVWSGWSPT